jgi:Thermostable hemolysin
MLPRLLIDHGNQWVVFTATASVRGILGQFRAPVVELTDADRDKVADCGDDWGRYYEADPRVMAGHLPDGLRFSFVRGET